MNPRFRIDDPGPEPALIDGAGSFTLRPESEALIASILPFSATLATLNYDLLPEEVTQQIEEDFSDDAVILGLMTTHTSMAVLLIREDPKQDHPDLMQFISVYGNKILSKLAAAGIRFINL